MNESTFMTIIKTAFNFILLSVEILTCSMKIFNNVLTITLTITLGKTTWEWKTWNEKYCRWNRL